MRVSGTFALRTCFQFRIPVAVQASEFLVLRAIVQLPGLRPSEARSVHPRPTVMTQSTTWPLGGKATPTGQPLPYRQVCFDFVSLVDEQ